MPPVTANHESAFDVGVASCLCQSFSHKSQANFTNIKTVNKMNNNNNNNNNNSDLNYDFSQIHTSYVAQKQYNEITESSMHACDTGTG